ncbi:hypothetical protein GE09DRAFT_317317 [Coniochaeta sp. 2T2.1]|nr:hypothetical protein GE09DRAFT_317317 [Coniochaeta sp. 2T2.1]
MTTHILEDLPPDPGYQQSGESWLLRLVLSCNAVLPPGAYGGVAVGSRPHIIAYRQQPPRALLCMSQSLRPTSYPKARTGAQILHRMSYTTQCITTDSILLATHAPSNFSSSPHPATPASSRRPRAGINCNISARRAKDGRGDIPWLTETYPIQQEGLHSATQVFFCLHISHCSAGTRMDSMTAFMTYQCHMSQQATSSPVIIETFREQRSFQRAPQQRSIDSGGLSQISRRVRFTLPVSALCLLSFVLVFNSCPKLLCEGAHRIPNTADLAIRQPPKRRTSISPGSGCHPSIPRGVGNAY